MKVAHKIAATLTIPLPVCLNLESAGMETLTKIGEKMTTPINKNVNESAATNPRNVGSASGTPIADKVTQTLHQSVDTLAEHAATAEEKIRQTASESSENVAEKQLEAQLYWEQSAIGKYTRENPVKTAGIAFAAGMFFTSLLRKK